MDDTNSLLQDIKRMDGRALTKVFDLYGPAIYKYAMRHCNDAILADQIVGDVFAKLLEQLSLGSGPSTNLRSYLFEIAYHSIVDEVRYSRRAAPIDVVEFAQRAAGSLDMTVEEHLLFGTLMLAIQCDLTEKQRHVILLRFFEGFSVKETALIMREKINNIEMIQYRAIAALRKAMDSGLQ